MVWNQLHQDSSVYKHIPTDIGSRWFLTQIHGNHQYKGAQILSQVE